MRNLWLWAEASLATHWSYLPFVARKERESMHREHFVSTQRLNNGCPKQVTTTYNIVLDLHLLEMKSNHSLLQGFDSSVGLITNYVLSSRTTMFYWNYRCSGNRPYIFWRNFNRNKRNATVLHFPIDNLFLIISNLMNINMSVLKSNGITFSTKPSIILIEDIVVAGLHSTTILRMDIKTAQYSYDAFVFWIKHVSCYKKYRGNDIEVVISLS